MTKQDEQIEKAKKCLNILKGALVKNIEPLTHKQIIEILDEIIVIFDENK